MYIILSVMNTISWPCLSIDLREILESCTPKYVPEYSERFWCWRTTEMAQCGWTNCRDMCTARLISCENEWIDFLCQETIHSNKFEDLIGLIKWFMNQLASHLNNRRALQKITGEKKESSYSQQKNGNRLLAKGKKKIFSTRSLPLRKMRGTHITHFFRAER